MAGTRTAPTVGALTVTENLIGFRVIDGSDDIYSTPLKTIGGGLADMAEIEALAAAFQPTTQASLFEVHHTAIWRGSANPSNAEFLARGSIADGLNLLYKDTDVFNAVQSFRIPAPVAALMVDNSDTPVYPLVAPMIAFNTALIALLGAGYSLESLQYTERRERSNNTKRRA